MFAIDAEQNVRGAAALAVIVGLSSLAVPAAGEELSAGLLLLPGTQEDAAPGDAAPSLDRFEVSRTAAAASFDFTPRNPLSLLFDEATADLAEPAELRLEIARDPTLSSRFTSLGSVDGGEMDTSPHAALEIGGALHWQDWVVGSGYSRAPLFGGEADLVSATLGYGPIQARLAYGQTERQRADTLDVLTLSTDLAAWSWLTLETDLAVGASEDSTTDSLAAGRLGIRLNF
jgi:hypothetical protein